MLPPGHDALEPFVARWSAATLGDRAALRDTSTIAERDAFHAVMSPLAPGIMAELGNKPLAQLDPAERRLLDLVLSFVHVALAIEIQGPHEPALAAARAHMAITPQPIDPPDARGARTARSAAAP